MFEVIGHHLHTTPVPPSMRTTNGVPSDLEAVILQCLRKSPAERPQHARALRDELRRKGMQRAREFSWERSVARTREIYLETSRA